MSGIEKNRLMELSASLISKKADTVTTELINKHGGFMDAESKTHIVNETVAEITFLFTKTMSFSNTDSESDFEEQFETWFASVREKIYSITQTIVEKNTVSDNDEEESEYFLDRYLKEHKKRMESRHKI